MVTAGATAWDRREGESATRYARFLEYLHTPRSERAKRMATHGRDREYAKLDDWYARGAAYDDQQDRDYEHARAEHAREVREFHAKAGRALLSFAISQIRELPWKPGELVKLADLARRMEMTAVFGSEREIAAVSHAAVTAAGVDADEWDKLAADLAATMPQR